MLDNTPKMKVQALTDIPAARDYLARIEAEPRGLRSAVVQETQGRYNKEVCRIQFDKTGTVTVRSYDGDAKRYEPTDAEQQRLIADFAAVTWPELKPLLHLIDEPPDMAAAVEGVTKFIFRDVDGKIVMVQVRINKAGGGKSYLPYTYWDDDKWRCMEPDGPLPLYNAHLLKTGSTTVIIHEGAKAAHHCQWMADGATREARAACAAHPWGEALKGAVHLGWIGGALNPRRTDWPILARVGVDRAYIVADNDAPGNSAVPHIARYLRCHSLRIQFTDEFPPGFDLADPWPDATQCPKWWGRRRKDIYKGPTFYSCVHPATWANDMPEDGKKGPSKLRDVFRNQWAYAEETHQFVYLEDPRIMHDAAGFNNMMAPFCYGMNISTLLLKSQIMRYPGLCYRPSTKERIVEYDGSSAINVYMPPSIKPVLGDAGPWLEFMQHLIPDEAECKEILKWCATLIAKPDIHMNYGLLLLSERQGPGKTTLGAKILAPLVGRHNTSFPDETDIVESQFNQWNVNKRLAVVAEIYQGKSWKAYNKLKGVIGNPEIEARQKHIRNYMTENWIHVVASSNSLDALKIEDSDRRWLIPTVTEKLWGEEKFNAFYDWLETDGLGIILAWAQEYVEHHWVKAGNHAPETGRKEEMIAESLSDGMKMALVVAEEMNNFGMDDEGVRITAVAAGRMEVYRTASEIERQLGLLPEADAAFPAAITMQRLRGHIMKTLRQPRLYETDVRMRRLMEKTHRVVSYERIKIRGYTQFVVMNSRLAAGVELLRERLLAELGAGNAAAVEDRVREQIRLAAMNYEKTVMEDF